MMTNTDGVAAKCPATQFLDDLFGSCPADLYALVWTMPGKVSTWFRCDRLQDVVVSNEKNTYVGCSLAAQDYGPHVRLSDKDGRHAKGIVGVWLDVDVVDPNHKKKKLPADKAEAKDFLAEVGPEPTILIDSGHGLQAWWLFSEPWIFADDSERGEAASLVERWNGMYQTAAKNRGGWSLDSTHDLQRVMRLPGSNNVKDPANIKPVVMLPTAGFRYERAGLAQLLPSTPSVLNGKHTPSANGNQLFGDKNSAPLSDDMVIAKAMAARNGEKFARAWNGDTSDFNSPSQADWFVCSKLVFYSGGNADQVERLLRQSKLFRPKWDEPRGEKTYIAETIANAIGSCKRFYDPHYGKRTPLTASALTEGQAADTTPDGAFQNFFEVATEDSVICVGLPIRAIHESLNTLTDNWPKSANGMLFVEDSEYAPQWMKAPAETFAWIGGKLPKSSNNNLKWMSGTDKVSQAQFHAFTVQSAERFEAVEQIPHYPPLKGHYYMHPPLKGGDGRALAELVGRFSPATNADRDLLLSAILTPFSGIEPGQRPAFLIQGKEDDKARGRGIGKTTFAELVCRLCGGAIDLRKNDDWDRFVTRMLSPAALTKRTVLLDNIKTLKFSWEELEAGITSAVISGRQLYVGEGRRPNTLTYFLTLNGANLSKDMAQRCVPIVVERPAYNANWEPQTIALIEERRWEIIGDIMAILQEPAEPLKRFSRWATWEAAVLSRVGDPSECQKVIEERQAAIDEDQTEADIVRHGIKNALIARRHDPETETIWMPSETAAQIVNRAENNESRPYPRAMAHLYTLPISEIRKSNRAHSRGCVWVGEKADPSKPAVRINDSYE